MFGRLLLPLDDEQVLLIPASAIQRAGQLAFVQIVSTDRLERHFVQLGRSFGNRVEVLSGLNPGDLVVVPRASAGVRQ